MGEGGKKREKGREGQNSGEREREGGGNKREKGSGRGIEGRKRIKNWRCRKVFCV